MEVLLKVPLSFVPGTALRKHVIEALIAVLNKSQSEYDFGLVQSAKPTYNFVMLKREIEDSEKIPEPAS